jgi:glycosyltransferase involved in cell wall biosynthesis
METKQKTICLCAIVKDEEKVIGRLIDSCIGIIDYWVIIDTGSTDNTKEFIKNKLKDIPGEISDSPFVNFGHNRTELVRKAKGKADYLLLMDADMTVHTNKTFNKSELTDPMYHIRYTGNLDFAQPLFVSGHIDWFYEGVTHEYITSKENHVPVELPSLIVTHHFDGGTRNEKLERDKQLLERDIIDNPGNVRSYFYLAQTYSNMSMHQQAQKYYQERVNRGGWPEEVYYSMYQIGVMLYHQGKHDLCKLALLKGYEYRPTRFECLYFLGVVCRELKEYNQASIYQEKVISMPYPKGDVLFVHRNQQEYLADFELGIVYYWINDYKKAEKHCRKVSRKKNVIKNIAEQNEKNLQFALESQGKIKGKGAKPFTVASMFTVGTGYEVEIRKLKASLDKFKVKYELVGAKPQSSWEKNTQMKPHVIKSVMDKYKTPVLWLDADAVVYKSLDFFTNIKGDVCYHTLTWNKGQPNEFNEMLVGTLWFDYNQKTANFLNAWINLNNQNNLPDGKNFQTIMESIQDMDKVPLPPEYIKIFDNDLIVAKDPVIVHNQASRRFKKDLVIEKKDIIKTVLGGMTSKYERCAIIGNGPFKTDMNKAIDDEKCFVMRCNNFQLNGFAEIGTKTNLNISSLNPEIVPKEKVDYPIFGVLPISETLYQQYTTAKLMHTYWQAEAVKQIELGNTVITYDDVDSYANLFKDIAETINAFPTVGVMAIATARWLGFKEILITGFTFFQSAPSHYFKKEIVVPSSHHNTLAEAELVGSWVKDGKKDGIKYILDDLTTISLKDHVRAKSDTIK